MLCLLFDFSESFGGLGLIFCFRIPFLRGSIRLVLVRVCHT